MKKKPFILGLTGSIGMGKTTTAGFFRDAGVPVWDADAAVHKAYGPNGAAVQEISRLCPQAVDETGVNRAVLKDWIASDPTAFSRLENIVHPLIAADRARFIKTAAEQGHPVVVVDIPLLFETGGDRNVDAVLVVTAPPDVQKARVLARDDMTEAHFAAILKKQMPDYEKRARADYIVKTTTPQSAQQDVARILQSLHQRIENDA